MFKQKQTFIQEQESISAEIDTNDVSKAHITHSIYKHVSEWRYRYFNRIKSRPKCLVRPVSKRGRHGTHETGCTVFVHGGG